MLHIGYKILLSLIITTGVTMGMNEKFKEGGSSETSSSRKRSSSATEIKAAQPTHVAFMSTSNVLDYAEFVVSTRELSAGLGSNFMVFASPWNGLVGSGDGQSWGNAISDTRLGVKYQMSPSLVVGGGLNMEEGQTGLAGFFSTKFMDNGVSTAYISPSVLIKFDDGWHSLGLNFGGLTDMNELFDIFWEAGFAHQINIYDADTDGDGEEESYTDGYGLLSGTGGMRITVPSAPFVYFDLGAALKQYLYKADDQGAEFLGAYINLGVAFTM